jgi:hypothetical protein
MATAWLYVCTWKSAQNVNGGAGDVEEELPCNEPVLHVMQSVGLYGEGSECKGIMTQSEAPHTHLAGVCFG